ncbi:MAG TPA: hypothetical protein VKB25_13695 [Conexibacter sp.]|nr:hypothetical protein [Conexibacter sp.]
MAPTEDTAFDRFLAAGTADDALGYPNGAQFIPADQEWADDAAWRALHHERRPVVIVADDHEMVLSPRRRSPLLRPLDGLFGSTPVLVQWRSPGDRTASVPYAVATHVGRHPLGHMRELAHA